MSEGSKRLSGKSLRVHIELLENRRLLSTGEDGIGHAWRHRFEELIAAINATLTPQVEQSEGIVETVSDYADPGEGQMPLDQSNSGEDQGEEQPTGETPVVEVPLDNQSNTGEIEIEPVDAEAPVDSGEDVIDVLPPVE